MKVLANIALGLALAATALTSGGCFNDCQKLCNEMGEYWEDCGQSFGDADVSDCRDAFGEDELLEKYESSCAALIRNAVDDDGNNTIALRAEYTCEEMEDGPGGAFGGGGE